MLRLKSLGYPAIFQEVEILTGLRMAKAQALLYYLVTENRLHDRTIFPKEQILDLLWPGMPTTSALQNLRQVIYHLRKALPEPAQMDDPDGSWLHTDRKTITLRTNPINETDLDWVQYDAGELPGRPRALAVFQEATGPFLAHFSISGTPHFDEWIETTRAHILRKQQHYLAVVIGYYREQGAHRSALPFLDQWCTLFPLEEAPVRQYIDTLLHIDRPVEARQVFAHFDRRLREALDQPAPDDLRQRVETAVQPGPSRLTQPWVRTGWMPILALILTIIGVGWAVWPNPQDETRLAILPFDNQTGRPYLADGLTDELTTRLSKMAGITTIARQSTAAFRDAGQDPLAIGEQLNTPFVLRGAVNETDAGLEVTVRLFDTRRGGLTWTHTLAYPQQEIQALQEALSQAIVRQVQGRLSGAEARLLDISTDNHQAYYAYLQARFHFNQANPDDLHRAVAFYQQAIDLDPDFLLAYSGLAWAYCTLAGSWGDQQAEDMLPQVQATLARIADEPSLQAESDRTLGWMHFWLLDLAQAETYMQRSVAQDPEVSFGLPGLAMFLTLREEYEAAESFAREALLINPHFFWNYFVLAQVYHYQGDFVQAEKWLQTGLSIFPNHEASISLLAETYLWQGDPQRAIAYLEQSLQNFRESIFLRTTLALAYIQADRIADARAIQNDLEQRYLQGTENAAYLAAKIQAQLGDTDAALDLLDAAFAKKSDELNWIRVDYPFRPLHAHPRFQQIVKGL